MSRVTSTTLGIAGLLSVLSLMLSPTEVYPPLLDLGLWVALVGVDTVQHVFTTPALQEWLVALGVLGTTAFATLRFGLWLRCRGRAGSAMLFCAAVLGVLPVGWVLFNIALRLPPEGTVTIPGWLGGIMRAIILAPMAFWWIVQTGALCLMSLGLLRSRLVPARIGLVGLIAAALNAQGLAEGLIPGLTPLTAIVETLFLLGLSASILLEPMRTGDTAIEVATVAEGPV